MDSCLSVDPRGLLATVVFFFEAATRMFGLRGWLSFCGALLSGGAGRKGPSRLSAGTRAVSTAGWGRGWGAGGGGAGDAGPAGLDEMRIASGWPADLACLGVIGELPSVPPTVALPELVFSEREGCLLACCDDNGGGQSV